MKTLANSTRMDMADFLRPYRAVVVEIGTTLADLLRPAFWVHKAGMLTAGTLLDVTTPDLTLDVQLRVLKSGKGLVHMRVMRAYASDASSPAEAAESAAEVPENYVVDHTTATGWRVRMRNPSVVVSTGHSPQAEAAADAARHAKAGAGEPAADEPKAAGPVSIPLPGGGKYSKSKLSTRSSANKPLRAWREPIRS